MTVEELAGQKGFSGTVLSEPREISSVYCADLLSWAMAKAPAGSAWCTVIGNINAVAVASLADVAAIILCEDASLDDDAKEKARQQGINILQTPLPAFAAGQAVYKAAGLQS